MIKTSILRKLHRILGVVIGIQLLIWTVSGAVFAWNDIESVRGDDMRVRPGPVTLDGAWISPTSIELGAGPDPAQIAGIDLVTMLGSTYYRIELEDERTVLANVVDGSIREPLTQEEAIALARDSFVDDVEVNSITLLTAEEVGAHHEYRSGPVPAWVVQLNHPSSTRVYVSQAGAAVTSHRNRTWRVFDFFWMLHTMDYRGRDDFNHALIKFVSLSAIALGLSGYFLFGRTSAVLRRRR